MAIFQTAYQQVLQHEGGYQSSPKDAGNYVNGVLVGTKYGIAAKTLARFRGTAITANDMKNLQPAEAAQITKAAYWDKMKGDAIKSQAVANQLLDFYFHVPGYAGKVLQTVVNGALVASKSDTDLLNPDGIIGQKTIDALNGVTAVCEAAVANALKQTRLKFYQYTTNRLPATDAMYATFKGLGIGAGSLGTSFYDSWAKRTVSYPDLPESCTFSSSKIAGEDLEGINRKAVLKKWQRIAVYVTIAIFSASLVLMGISFLRSRKTAFA